MAKVRAKTLTCPNCGSPVPVRNVFKAKLVVCDSCDSQLDLTTPDFKVLGALPERIPPQDALCLGLKGTLADDRSFEIIGRLRFTDYDDEESWFWDEWLLLAENGEYLWLSEEGKSFELHTKFIPENPPDIDTMNSSRVLNVDGTEYRVKERGTPKISYVEGELTWRATPGDEVSYIDARGPGGGFGVEFTSEEIEFFRRQRLSRVETYRMCGLDGLLALEDRRDELRAEYQRGPKAMGCGAFIMAGGAMAAFFAFLVIAVAGTTAGSGTRPSMDVASLEASTNLGASKLTKGSEYRLQFDSLVHPATTSAELAVTDPTGAKHVVLTVANIQKTGEADLITAFEAEHDGLHMLELNGKGSLLAGVGDPASTAITNVKWTVMAVPLKGEGFFFAGPFLLACGFVMFIISAGRRSAASARAAREYRHERADFIELLHRESRVQS